MPTNHDNMSYHITVPFESSLPVPAIYFALQSTYDTNGVDGLFRIEINKTPNQPNKVGRFHREICDDREYVKARVTNPASKLDWAAAAVEQLIAELTNYDPEPEALPIVEALKAGRAIVENVELLADCPLTVA